MTRAVLVDTGPLVALRNKRDQHRERIEALAVQLPEHLITCWPVLTEAAHLLRQHPQEVEVLLNAVHSGVLRIAQLTSADVAVISSIMKKYADHSVSLADASLMYLAERDGIDEVFTIDAKDLSLFRKSDGRPLQLIT
jgi:predicted nucleic acid-binding protein